MLESAVDSNKLLNVVEKVTDVVNMFARTRPPPLEPPAYMRDYDRDTSIGVSASSGSASTGVDPDSSGAEGMYHTPEPAMMGKSVEVTGTSTWKPRATRARRRSSWQNRRRSTWQNRYVICNKSLTSCNWRLHGNGSTNYICWTGKAGLKEWNEGRPRA